MSIDLAKKDWTCIAYSSNEQRHVADRSHKRAAICAPIGLAQPADELNRDLQAAGIVPRNSGPSRGTMQTALNEVSLERGCVAGLAMAHRKDSTQNVSPTRYLPDRYKLSPNWGAGLCLWGKLHSCFSETASARRVRLAPLATCRELC